MWRHVDLMWTDVSEERTAPIFLIEERAIVSQNISVETWQPGDLTFRRLIIKA
jgi:hypothetical protein